MRTKTVGIIGDSMEKPELNKIAEELGKRLAEEGISIVTGGREGVMGAASKGAQSVHNRLSSSRVIGILPGTSQEEGNIYIDYAIPTGIGWARNQIVVLSSDIVVAVGGGAGTLSEMAYAWAYNKPIIAFHGVDGWSDKMGDKAIDDKRKDKILSANNVEEAIKIIKDIFSKFHQQQA